MSMYPIPLTTVSKSLMVTEHSLQNLVNMAGDGELDGPHGISVDHSGNVYVSDKGNERIVVFSPKWSTV